MMIYLIWGYLAASAGAFFVYYAACVVAASADRLQQHRQTAVGDALTLYHFLR